MRSRKVYSRSMRQTAGTAAVLLLCVLSNPSAVAMTGLPEVDEILREEHLNLSYDETGHGRLTAAIAAIEDALDLPEGFRASRERDVEALPMAVCDAELATLLSQFHFILANAFLDEPQAIEEAYLCGKHWGLKSLRLNPRFAAAEGDGFAEAVAWVTDVGALYWTSLNWLRTVELNNLAAVGSGVLSKTRAMLERALDLDPSYYACGPSRALGSFWGGLPRKPFGTYRKNLDRAFEYFAPLLDTDSCDDTAGACAAYLENRLNYVQFVLVEQREWPEAAQHLTALLLLPAGDLYPLENALALEKASALLLEIEEHL